MCIHMITLSREVSISREFFTLKDACKCCPWSKFCQKNNVRSAVKSDEKNFTAKRSHPLAMNVLKAVNFLSRNMTKVSVSDEYITLKSAGKCRARTRFCRKNNVRIEVKSGKKKYSQQNARIFQRRMRRSQSYCKICGLER